MKYPLVEKLERLIYLRDANVIDYDLIGYLARFMGYDITDAKNDVDANRMYATRKPVRRRLGKPCPIYLSITRWVEPNLALKC